MEIKINKEIKEYNETVFFGLSMRECICSILACAAAVAIYFGFRDLLGTETVSWLCIIGAAPFGALGFIKYNGMTAEQIVRAWIRSEILMPKYLVFTGKNEYGREMRDQDESISEKEKTDGNGCDSDLCG